MLSLPILYTFRRCPYAMRARMALHYASYAYEWIPVNLRQKPDELFNLSPKGTVPVLMLSEHNIIDESIDIMQWALKHRDPLQWSIDVSEKHTQDKSLHTLHQCFIPHLNRYKYPNRYPDTQSMDHYQAGMTILQHLDACLQQQAGMLGTKPRWVDYAWLPFIRQWAYTDHARWKQNKLSTLQHWLSQQLESTLFQSVMIHDDPTKGKKYPVDARSDHTAP